jgi:cellulose biosynthesis protein BcsQ
MDSMPEPELGIEFKGNPFTGELGIGFTIKGKGALKAPARLQGFFGGDNTVDLDKELVKEIVARARTYPRPDVSKFAVGSYWRELEQQPQVTAVISGKGGVGKTSIALGLAELYSASEDVLIVDFDLHNRGLTSKYGPLSRDSATVLGEMRRFSQTILPDQRLPREGGRLVLSKIDEDLFDDLRQKFCYVSYPRANKRAPLKLEYLYHESVRKSPHGKARPQNCYFLPSRRGGDTYLGSQEALFDVAEVSVFLTFLNSLASRYGISRVILDCHGAHDLFMVGAILAASHLVIVTRPEPAAFEGTLELVRFAESVVEAQAVFPSKRTLIFNEYRDVDRLVAETLVEAIYTDDNNKEQFESFPRINSSDEIRDLLKYYSEPSILQHPLMGPAIQALAE